VKRARLRIAGRVQGVGFRWAVAERARSLGIAGSVENLADGTVEALLEGEDDRVDSLVRWCGEGPRGARVDDVRVSWEEPEGRQGFGIR
jgi:acylphosphatase